MVAYLERPTDSDDFTEIVDFLNANPIRYALTVNPTIYVSCIEQFWSTAKAQKSEDTQIHALVDVRKIIITESSLRENAHLQMRMCLSPKKTAWNEFSSNIASAIICLATNQKFNFSKMVLIVNDKNLDSLFAKFLMYPRAATTASSLEAEQVSGNITKTRSKATLNEPTPQGTGSGSGPRRQDTKGDIIARTSMQLKELMEMCTNLLQRVQELETTKTAQAKEIISLKKRVKKLEQRGRSRTPGLKRLYKVGTSRSVESSTEARLGDQEDASKQGRNIVKIDADDMTDQEVNVAEKEVSAADAVTTAGEVVTTASVDISTASVPIIVSTATTTTPPTTTTKDDMTLAETLMEIKSAKPKAI
ncbi:hypothetical protein Tco_0389152 [Tanacetum coccineum]